MKGKTIRLKRPDLATIKRAKKGGLSREECWKILQKSVEAQDWRLSEKAMSLAIWRERLDKVYGKSSA